MSADPSAPSLKTPAFQVRFAETALDIEAAQRLRYDVFVRELGGAGPMVDHDRGLEADSFDAHCDHLLLHDMGAPGDPVVGVYRLLRQEVADRLGGFYTESEFDLTPLRASGKRLLELGRSCLHADYRGGTAMYEIWNALARYVTRHEIDLLFGTASFHGTDAAPLREALSLLHHRHLAPPELRVRARDENFQPMNLCPEPEIDRPRAMRQVPALIKGYLRLGGMVGEGAWIDHAFNTIDICLIMDTARLNETQRAIYAGGRGQ